MLAYNGDLLIAKQEESLEEALDELRTAIDKLETLVKKIKADSQSEVDLTNASEVLISGKVTEVEGKIVVLKGKKNVTKEDKDKIEKLIKKLPEDSKEKLENELKNVVLVTEETSMEIENIDSSTRFQFMAKSITKESSNSQKVVQLNELLKHFNEDGYKTKDGLKLEIKAREKELVLKNTGMSTSLFDEIKSKDGAEKDKPYRITILKGENKKTDKIAKIAFYQDGSIELEKIEKTEEDKVKQGTASAKVTSNGEDRKSLNITLPEGNYISDLTKLDVSLADADESIIATNKLNKVGFFLHGNEKGQLSNNLFRELRENNLKYWTEQYNALKIKEEQKEWKENDKMPLISVEDAKNIDTTFIHRDADVDGTLDKTMLSAWDQGRTNGNIDSATKIIIEYTINNQDYKVVIDIA